MSAVSPDAEAGPARDGFRAECRSWLEDNCPAEMRQPMHQSFAAYWGGRRARFSSEAERLWFERMAAKGWTAPDWPTKYGGGGLMPDEAQVLREELARIDARPPLIGFGVWMLGPALLEYGTEEQKRHFLPQMARGEIRWCQGYSEPNAGSDLASLRTQARLAGEDYIVEGMKIWSSYANEADWIFCLVRSELEASKQAGISILLFDLESPGVTIQPIEMIDGSREFCQIFFDQVRVPADQRLGAAGSGWTIAKRIMEYEREMIGGSQFEAPPVPGEMAAMLARLHEPAIAVELARYDIDLIAFQAATEQLAAEGCVGGQPLEAAASVVKLEGANLEIRRKELVLQMSGWEGLAWPSDSDAGGLARSWLRARGSAIAGGTNEVQLNIIAKHALRLG